MIAQELRIAVFSTFICLLMPVAAFAWTPGEPDGEGGVFLFEEKVEGVYGNNWWGKSLGPIPDRFIEIKVTAEGKTAEFEGVLSLDCRMASGHQWKAASNFRGSVNADEIVPHDVPVNARKFFCP